MEFLDVVKKVESHKDFSVKGVLAHGFISKDSEWGEWHVGYYDSSTDTMSSFLLQGDELVLLPAEEIFKKDEEVLLFDKNASIISLGEVEALLNELMSSKYPGHTQKKIILLLQRLPEGQVYNVTVVTDTFNLLNARFEASTGDLLSSDFSSLLSFGGPE